MAVPGFVLRADHADGVSHARDSHFQDSTFRAASERRSRRRAERRSPGQSRSRPCEIMNIHTTSRLLALLMRKARREQGAAQQPPYEVRVQSFVLEFDAFTKLT